MLRKVKLYGELAKFVGHREFEVKVETVGKAVSFLVHNFPFFGANCSIICYKFVFLNHNCTACDSELENNRTRWIINDK